MKKQYATILFTLFMFFNSTLSFANTKNTEGGVTGTITDAKGDPIIGVSIQLLNTSLGAVTDENGKFDLKSVPNGKYILRASFIGFLTQDKAIEVGDVPLSLNFNLTEDVFKLQEVLVTGGNALKKVESSVAITTLSAKELQIRAPLNTSDMFRGIPGLQVESYGGNGPGNVFVRGFPQTGGYAFIGMMEDGLPIVPTNTSRNVSPDIYFKVDYTIRSVEAVRGGNASLLMPNSAGAVVNNISYTGGEKMYGKFGYTRGLSQNLNRLDGNIGGSLSKNIRYNIGGFYRGDEGIISPGFVGTKGGQVKANLSYLFNDNKGFVRFYVKKLDEKVYWSRQSYYKYDGSGTAQALPQYDLFSQSLVPQETAFSFTLGDGTEYKRDYKDGMHPNITYSGVQFHYETAGGWQINNNLRYSSTKYSNVAVGFNAPAAYGSTRKYYYLDGPSVTVDPAALYVNLAYNIADGTDKQFVDYLDFRKTIAKNNITVGFGLHNTNIDYLQITAAGIEELKPNPRRLLVNKTTGTDVTTTATTNRGAIASNRGVTRTVSAYIQDEVELTKTTRLNVGVRMDADKITGQNPIYGGTATNATPAGKGFYITGYTPFPDTNKTYYSYTAGLNQKLSENSALFGRYTKSYNALSIYDITLLGFNPALIKTRNISLGELGARYGKNNMAVFASLVYASVENVALTFFVPNNAGAAVRYPAFGSTRTLSAEIEASYRPLSMLGFRLVSTVQNAQYTNFTFTAAQDVRDDIKGKSYDWSGNKVEALPKLSVELTTNFTYKKLNANLIISHIGDRFTAASNTVTMAAYTTMNAMVGYNVTKNFKLNLYGYNITNVRGLVAGDARGDQFVVPSTLVVGKVITGAGLFPRNFTASLVYEF
jgi:iron complex outermembrane recepter protein